MTITVFQSITLDGVVQGPGRADEDTRGGFPHGGWGNGYQDEASMRYVAEGMGSGGGLLLGHRTYRDILDHWTNTSAPNPFTQVLLTKQKYVVSRNAGTTLEYPNSTLLAGDGVARVRALGSADEQDLMILGSGELIRALHAARLVDRYVLQIHPIVLGSGTRLFGAAERADLVLGRTISTPLGVLIAEYAAR